MSSPACLSDRGWTGRINSFAFILISAFVFLPLRFIIPPLLSVFRQPSEFALKALPSLVPTLFFAYAIVSMPVAALLWKLHPSSRWLAYLYALALSVLISLIEIGLGVLNFLTYFLYFGAGSLLMAPIMTYNLGPVLWGIVMGELRWQTRHSSREFAP